MISISIPSFNRSDLTIRSFISVLNDSRVSEIVINDDASNIDIYDDLCSKVKSLENDKIKVFRNSENIGSFLNKRKSVSLSTNEWVILLDSDNIVNTDYLDINAVFPFHKPHLCQNLLLIFQQDFRCVNTRQKVWLMEWKNCTL